MQACGIHSILTHNEGVEKEALPLVAFVFALLTFGLYAIYTFYLVVRCSMCIQVIWHFWSFINCVLQERNKLAQRRSSFIEAAMMGERV